MVSTVGAYSKHARRYREDKALQYGHWYIDPESEGLYIVPTIGRAEGPLGDKLDQLNTLYGSQPLTEVNIDVIARLTGLEPVRFARRQFDSRNGYHVA